jgi:hypothetical protein
MLPTKLLAVAALFCSVVGDSDRADEPRDNASSLVKDPDQGSVAGAEKPFQEKFRMILILRAKNFFEAVETFQNLIVLFCELLLLQEKHS